MRIEKVVAHVCIIKLAFVPMYACDNTREYYEIELYFLKEIVT